MKKLSTLLDILEVIKEQSFKEDFFNFYHGKKITRYSNREVLDTIKYIAFGLLSEGIKKGDNIGLLSISSPQWTLFDFAIMAIGAKSIPLFDTASKEHILFQMEDTKMNDVFVSSLGYNEKFSEIFKSKQIKLFSYKKENNLVDIENRVHIEDLIEKGKLYGEKNNLNFEDIIAERREDEIVTIIYTSGTTGRPKGVLLNHRNFTSQLEGFSPDFKYLFTKEHLKSACILPLAHIFQRTILYYFLFENCCVYYLDPKDISKHFGLIKPELLIVVPRLLEKVYDKLMLKEKQATGIKKWLMKNAFDRAKNKDINSSKTFMDKVYDRLVYKNVREIMGGEVQLMISGGAAISNEVFSLFYNVGFPLYQGYGLTETSPVISAGYRDHVRLGSVGPILKNIQAKISEDSEVLVKGDLVMQGYYNNEEETKKTFDAEGWFLTGDYGYLDDDGYLFITGRKKELLKASNGKYIAPAPIESKLIEHEFFEYALIIGDGKKFISVLLFPNFEALPENKKSRNLEHLNDEDFFKQESVLKEVKQLVDIINKKLPSWEKMSRFKIIVKELSIVDGELTPKFSVKREVIKKKYMSYIDEIYKRFT